MPAEWTGFVGLVRSEIWQTEGDLVAATTPLIRLIQFGAKRLGVFRVDPPAKVGAYHDNGLLLRVLTRPSEHAQVTASLVLRQMLPALAI